MVGFGAPTAAQSLLTDLVFHNGRVLTVDARFSIAQAVAVKDGRIHAVGGDRDVLAAAGANARVIDLRGRTLMPGLCDAHAHMDREGLKYLYPSLGGARSVEDVLAIVAREVKKAKPGEWIVTMPLGDPPYYQDPPPTPTRGDLDRVSPDNPVYIRGIWGYWNKPPIVSVANSRALALAGITRDTAPPYAGITIHKDAAGEPTGVFSEADFVPTLEFSLFSRVPRFTHELRVKGLRDAMRRYNAAGTTSIYEGHGMADESIAAYRELHARGELTVRSRLVFSPTPGRDLIEDVTERSRGVHNDAMLTLEGVFLQGGGDPDVARLARAALPYTGWGSYYYESLTPERLRELALQAARHDIRVNSIAPVQKIVDDTLAVLEEVNRVVPLAGRRWVFSHVGPFHRENVDALKRLGLIATGIPAETVWKKSHLSKTPEKDWDTYAPYRSIVEAGVPFALATDNNPPRPFVMIWAAVSRSTRMGEVLNPGERLTREQALRAMTINGAYLSFEEQSKGSIEKGKHADLVVIEEDYLTMPEQQIQHLQPAMTVVGGRVVHES